MRAPAWEGDHRITAGYRYSSGALHAAWDVGMWRGTKLYAPWPGVVTDLQDGVNNNPPGYNPGSGAPSNWITLHEPTQDVTLYYQHLSPGLKVSKGQRVDAGQLLGYSGNTGNSSGDHLHLAGIKGKRHKWDRYIYLRDHSTQVYPPDETWKDYDMPLSDADIEKVARAVWERETQTGWQSDGTYDKGKPRKVNMRGALIHAEAGANRFLRGDGFASRIRDAVWYTTVTGWQRDGTYDKNDMQRVRLRDALVDSYAAARRTLTQGREARTSSPQITAANEQGE